MNASLPRPQLLLPLRNRAALLELLSEKGDGAGVFVPGVVDVPLGAEVDLEISFAEEQVRFHLRALVKWKRTSSGLRSLLQGIGLDFIGSDKSSQQHLLDFVHGGDVHHVERDSRRYGVHVDVRTKNLGVTKNHVTDDLSEGGCFVLMDAPLPVGAPVELKLRAEGSIFGWMTVHGVVAWQREGERAGVGVEFAFQTERERAKVHKLVRVLRARLVRELKVTTPRPSQPPTPALPTTA